MPQHPYLVTVDTATAEQADTVMAERLGHDEDYGFDYGVDFTKAPSGEVFVLVIEHRHGFDVTAHRTQDGALDTVHGYVAQWWDQEINGGRADKTPMPADRDEAIRDYFEMVEGEWHTVTATVVAG